MVIRTFVHILSKHGIFHSILEITQNREIDKYDILGKPIMNSNPK